MRPFIAAMLILIHTPLSAQELSPGEVEAAINAGVSNARIPSFTCYADKWLIDTSGFHVTMYGPVGRIMAAARAAKQKYQRYTAADVSEDLRRRALHLIAIPSTPRFTSGRWSTTVADHVVIMPKGAAPKAEDVLQPHHVTPEPVSWSNAMGGKREGRGLNAIFSVDEFHAMPEGDLDVAVIAGGEENRCKIGKKDRAALR